MEWRLAELIAKQLNELAGILLRFYGAIYRFYFTLQCMPLEEKGIHKAESIALG